MGSHCRGAGKRTARSATSTNPKIIYRTVLLLPLRFHGGDPVEAAAKLPLIKENDFISLAGAPEEIRTPDPQIRSLVLYPAELRAPMRIAREMFPEASR